MYTSCVTSCLIHGSDTWPMKKEHEVKLVGNEMSMLRWICSFKRNKKLSWCWQTRAMVPFDMLGIVSYQYAVVTFSIRSAVFQIFDFKKMSWPWNPGQKSLKVI